MSRLATYDDWRAARYFPALDGLRAVAALLVVLHHARHVLPLGALEGWNGVTLFFVLSGFLITTLALREEERLGALRWRAFFVRRCFRILPIYLASLALYAATMAVLHTDAAHRASFGHAVPWYLSPFPEVPFFQSTHVVFALCWSLGIEEKFYLLWPLLAFVLLRGRATSRLGLAVVLALVMQLPLLWSTGGRAVAPYSAILVGCVLAFLLHNRTAFARISRLGSRAGLALAVTLLVAVQALTHAFPELAGGFRVASPFYYLPYSIAAALVVGSLALRAPGSRPFESRPLRFVGAVSYPLYLVHPIGLGVAAGVLAPGGMATELAYLGLGLTLAIALAYALHRTVELPLIAVGKRIAGSSTPRRPRPAAGPSLRPSPSASRG